MKEKAILAGPFIGELWWEIFCFAPYLLYLKRKNPENKLIVFTRKERFDLYGKSADILIPLRIKGDGIAFKEESFRLSDFTSQQYTTLYLRLAKKYQSIYKIVDHIFPQIDDIRYRFKWQFPRDKMLYSFNPRESNKILLNQFMDLDKPLLFVDLTWNKNKDQKLNIVSYLSSLSTAYDILVYDYDRYSLVKNIIDIKLDDKSSVLGCLILAIKNSSVCIGNLNSYISNLSLLLKTPLVSINEEKTKDEIKLVNPLKTKILFANNIDSVNLKLIQKTKKLNVNGKEVQWQI